MIRVLAIISLGVLAVAAAMADDSSWPGGVAFIDLGPAEGPPVTVEYNGRRALVMQHEGRRRAVIGVPLEAPTGRATITLSDGASLSFEVWPQRRWRARTWSPTCRRPVIGTSTVVVPVAAVPRKRPFT